MPNPASGVNKFVSYKVEASYGVQQKFVLIIRMQTIATVFVALPALSVVSCLQRLMRTSLPLFLSVTLHR